MVRSLVLFTFFFGLCICLPLSNDECSFSKPIVMDDNGQALVVGTTIGAIRDPLFSSCDGTVYPNEGVWYTFLSENNNQFSSSLCQNGGVVTFPAALFLMKGDCNSIECVATLNKDCESYLGTIEKYSLYPNSRYFILIQPIFPGDQGDFILFVQIINAPENQDYANALYLPTSDLIDGIFVTGTTEHVDYYYGSEPIPECDFLDLKTLWYKFYSEKYTRIKISLCAADGGIINTNSTVPTLFLIESNYYYCAAESSGAFSCPLIDAAINKDSEYHIGVATSQMDAEFTVFMQLLPELIVMNTDCASAMDITSLSSQLISGVTSTGNTRFSYPCLSYDVDSLQSSYVWYNFASGVNTYAIISFCEYYGASVSFQAQIVLLTGPSCSSLECHVSTSIANNFCDPIRGGDDGITLTTEITPNTIFYLFIGNIFNNRGNFKFYFELRPVSPFDNNYCETASPIRFSSSTSTLSDRMNNLVAVEPGLPYFYEPNFNGMLWYSFNSATSNYVIASFCDGVVEFSATAYLYTGNCSNLLPVPVSSANTCEYNAFIKPRTEYYLTIASSTDSRAAGDGTFEVLIELSSLDQDENDYCEDAIAIQPGLITGIIYQTLNDITGNHLFPADCGRAYYPSNIWYTFNSGANNQVSISFCSDMSGAFANLITLFSGSCSSAICVAESSYGCYDEDQNVFIDSLTDILIEPSTDYWVSIGIEERPTEPFPFNFQFELTVRPPAYDDCRGATELLLQSGLAFGDILFSTQEIDLPPCGTIGTQGSVWYTFNSYGATSALFSLVSLGAFADFQAVLTFYYGTCNNPFCESQPPGLNELTILLTPNTQYFVLVSSMAPSIGTSFALYYRFNGSPPVNGICSSPLELFTAEDPAPLVINQAASTWFTVPDATITACSLSLSPLLWFEIHSPPETSMVLQLFGSNLPDGFIISLLEGVDCTKPLNCLASNYDGLPGLTANLLPDAYYLLAIGNPRNSTAFHLSIQYSSLINSQCEFAQEILLTAPTQLLLGSTTPDNQQAWYYFNSTSYNSLIATTCDPITGEGAFDTILTIYSQFESAQCNKILPIAFSDDNCNVNTILSTANAPLVLNSLYFVELAGFQGETGEFRLTVTLQNISPPNDECPSAIELHQGDQITGSYFGSTVSLASQTVCGTSAFHPQNGDVWYTFSSMSFNFALISLCSNSTSDAAPLFFYLYSGECRNLVCVAESDTSTCPGGRPMLNTILTVNTIYYLVIGGTTSDSQAGTFVLALDLVIATMPSNDLCANPVPIATGNSFLMGSTQFSTQDIISSPLTCGGDSGNVWYSFDSAAESFIEIRLQKGVATPFYFAMKLNLYKVTSSIPSDCSNLQLFATDENSCSDSDTPYIATFISPNTVYYISVGGGNGQQGSFYIITYTDQRTPPNDSCFSATQIVGTSAVFTGTTVYSTPDFDLGICITRIGNVWYTFNNLFYNYLRINFCTGQYATDFAGQAGLYTGVCDYYYATLACYSSPFTFSGDCSGNDLNEHFLYLDILYTDFLLGITAGDGVSSLNQGIYSFQFDLFLVAPGNDECDNAYSISNGNRIKSGYDISGATRDIVSACGNTVGNNVWFSFSTNSFDTALITFCDDSLAPETLTFDAALYLFEGDCDDLTCVAYNDDACAGYKPQLKVRLSRSTSYLLSVAALDPVVISLSYFAFVFELSNTATSVSYDACEFANPIPNIANNPTLAIDTFPVATSDIIDPICGLSQTTTMGLWYTFYSGGNNYIEISTCRQTDSSTYPVLLALFKGTCGQFANCFPQQESCAPIGAEILTALAPDTNYLLLVGGYYPTSIGELILSFNLTTADVPANDFCVNAETLIAPTSKIFGSIEYASADIVLSGECGTRIDGGVNVWYNFQSNQYNYMNAHFCSPDGFSSYNSKLFLYQGDSCDALECVTGNDSGCPNNYLAAAISTYIDPKNTFYLMVAGARNDRGVFNLDFSLENIVPENDHCINAIAIEEFSTTLFNTLILATPDLAPCLNLLLRTANIWYSFQSDRYNYVTITSCGDSTPSTLAIALYEGDCDSNICLATDATSCESSHPSITTSITLYKDYLFSVFASNTLNSAFELSFLLEQTPPTNDNCLGAKALLENGNQQMETGYQIQSFSSDFVNIAACPSGSGGSTADSSFMVWYTFYSEMYNYLLISFCEEFDGSSQFPTKIYLFQEEIGSLPLNGNQVCEQNMLCVASDENGCDSSNENALSHLETPVNTSSTYYFAIASRNASVGYFQFNIELQQRTPSNSECDTPISLDGIVSRAFLGERNFVKALLRGDNYFTPPLSDISSLISSANHGLDACPPNNILHNNLWWYFYAYDFNHLLLSLCPATDSFVFADFVDASIFLFQLDSQSQVEDICSDNLLCKASSAFNGGCTDQPYLETYISPNNKFVFSLSTPDPGDSYGQFAIAFSLTKQPPINDECTSAMRLGVNGSVKGDLYYSTEESNYLSFISDCIVIGEYELSAPNTVWFSFNSQSYGLLSIIYTCETPSFVMESKIHLLLPTQPPSCSNFNCVAAFTYECVSNLVSRDALSPSQAPLLPSTDYFLLLAAQWYALDYQLDYQFSNEAPNNDKCASATEITSPSTKVPGSLLYSTPDVLDASFCGVVPPPHSVWYYFNSSSFNYVTLSLCDASEFDSSLFLFAGSNCSALLCVSANDNFCASNAYISASIRQNIVYFVAVAATTSIPPPDSFELLFELSNVSPSPSFSSSPTGSSTPFPSSPFFPSLQFTKSKSPSLPMPTASPSLPPFVSPSPSPSAFPSTFPSLPLPPSPSFIESPPPVENTATRSFNVQQASILPPPPMQDPEQAITPTSSPSPPSGNSILHTPSKSINIVSNGGNIDQPGSTSSNPIIVKSNEASSIIILDSIPVYIESENGDTVTVELPNSLIDDSINQLVVRLADASISNQPINALSLIVSLELFDRNGNEYDEFDDSVEICFSVPDGEKNGGECLAYFDEKKGEWICEDSCVKVKNNLIWFVIFFSIT